MPVYHIVIFRLKPSATQESITQFKEKGAAMVGKIPGLLKIDFNPPLAATAHRSKGFDMGLVAILEKPADIEVYYATHPAHLEVHELREKLCDETLVYDLEYSL